LFIKKIPIVFCRYNTLPFCELSAKAVCLFIYCSSHCTTVNNGRPRTVSWSQQRSSVAFLTRRKTLTTFCRHISHSRNQISMLKSMYFMYTIVLTWMSAEKITNLEKAKSSNNTVKSRSTFILSVVQVLSKYKQNFCSTFPCDTMQFMLTNYSLYESLKTCSRVIFKRNIFVHVALDFPPTSPSKNPIKLLWKTM